MSRRSHYPLYNVMKERNEWDDHTQSIVESRINVISNLKFLTPEEADRLKSICSLLIDDRTGEVMDFIIEHIDQTLDQSPGESQRKVGVPAAPKLVRSGLRAIETGAQVLYSCSFKDLDEEKQMQYLQQISDSIAKPQHIWASIPQRALFMKLLELTVEAYCSHPRVWSAIGYGGPAYPRGYVRTQIGHLDPWEAQPEK